MVQEALTAAKLIAQAQKAFSEGDNTSARRLLEQAARLAPENEEVWLWLGAVAAPRESIHYLNKALRINPGSQRAHKGLIWALERLQSSQKTVPSAQEAAAAAHELDQPTNQLPKTKLLSQDKPIPAPVTSSAQARQSDTNATSAIRSRRFGIPPFFQFFIRRTFSLLVSLVVITMLLYGGMMLIPVDTRARLYLPPGRGGQNAGPQVLENYKKEFHLNDPYLVQYFYWARSLFEGTWGYSPVLNGNVLPELLHLTPATAELTFYSMLVFIPLGLISGVSAGWRQRQAVDNIFRFTAFIATSLPPFILSMVLIAFFYIGLHWFAPDRLSSALSYKLESQNFIFFTGMYTLDGLLNNRLDVTIDAFRHLAMPVATLALYYWATLARISRVTTITEKQKEYITAARARGVRENSLVWKHIFRNILAPSFTSLGLSAASLVTGVFVVELVYNYRGISNLIVKAMQGTQAYQGVPDTTTALGFSVYSTLVVLTLMFILDLIQAAVDPRIREEVIKS